MASVDVEIASRRYSVACRDGEEEHLRSVAAVVDGKAREAAQALGPLSEARQLLFASLLLADELKEREAGAAPPPPPPAPQEPEYDRAVATALERLAERMEMLAERLESGRALS
ncbi:MAG TPA: cell division protein ZapA [Allosphingosinicella sp.]|nr:cell division protein ZapA [Allosphingosinicella sp.]